MDMTTLQKFCVLTNGSFIVYDDISGTFGRCFLWISIATPVYLIFAIQCAYLLGVSKPFTSIRTSLLVSAVNNTPLLLGFSSLIEVILCYAIHDREEHPPAYVLARAVSFTTWMLCFLLQYKVTSITREKKQNTKYILPVLVLILISSSMQLHYVLNRDKYSDQFRVDYFGSIVDFSLTVLFFLICFAVCVSEIKSGHPYKDLDEDNVSVTAKKEIDLGQAETSTNYLSRAIYWWSDKLLWKGMKRQLRTPDDLFTLPDSLNTHDMKDILKHKFNEEKIKYLNRMTKEELHEHYIKRKSLKISMFKVLNRCFGKVYYCLGILKLCANTCQLVQPTLVNLLVTFVSDKSEPMSHGYYYALGFFGTSLLSVLFDLHYRYQIKKTNLKVRAALVSVIYEKTLAIRSSSLSKSSTGKIVNLMSTDTDRVRNFCDTFHECWSVPFQLIVCLYLLYEQVGIAVLAVMAFCVLIVPFASRMYKQVKNYQTKVLGQRDMRIKLICEILFGIRIIKYNAWEEHFKKTVNEIRDPELRYNLITKWLFAGMICIWGSTVAIISILSIGTYVLMGNSLDAAKVFTTMAIIDRLVNPLNGLSWNISNVIDAWVSIKRIQTYLCLPEMRLNDYYTKGVAKGNLAVKLKDCNFCWSFKNEEKEPEYIVKGCCCCKTVTKKEEPEYEATEAVVPFELKDITFSVKQGQFIGITGKVGSGKSSLFASITAEMEKDTGEVDLNDKLDGIAYVTQEPWIQHMSIRDNILFGRPYDETRYNDVIYACALNDDINLFSAGDSTEVGESGVNLSGGQKARLALARAVYQDKDMYLLDDPIAAVDAHVAKHLYRNCFNGFLKNKTRILSTHHTKFLHQCDHVVLLQDGAVHSQGLPDDVLKDIADVEETAEEDEENNEKENEEKEKDEIDEKEGKLIESEDQRTGNLSFKVYQRYFTAFGTKTALTVFIGILLRQATKNFQDWWLSYWVEQTAFYGGRLSEVFYGGSLSEAFYGGSVSEDDSYYLSIYGYLLIASFVFLMSRTLLHAVGSIRASRGLHRGLLNAVMDTPIPFFDITPVGRIVNRFSTDISDIDDSLPLLMSWFMVQVACIVGTLILTVYSLPWFAIMVVPLGLLYYFIQLVYRRSSRELKRISSVARSPLYEHFTETLSGYMVIRSFRETDRFIEENELKLDRSQRAEYNENLASMWLTFRLDMIGVLMVTSISILAVLEHQFGFAEAGLIGLAITYSLQITPLLGGLLTVFTETEKQMIRVERVTQYIEETPREEKKSKNLPSSWPANGRVVFDNVCFQYRENLPMALKSVTLDIKSGEKIGICGRTGSGKSTILKVLFNIVDVNSGSVLIDGVNSSKVDFSILRSRMSIIPQDPFLFNDTVSKNLDPAQNFSTYEMMDVIQKCHLAKLVEDLGGLEGNVGEKGSNLSAGQKQLLCLARALLKKSMIICIDEATASVDLETDKLIQVTIREEFAQNTVLTIAHRMNTIIDSDRVLVMEAGRVLEFAPPDELLADSTSEFYSLVNESSSTK